MFGFRKSVKERIEPEFDKEAPESQESEKSLADILGAQENDTNITAGVDAILDEEATLDDQQSEINQNNIDFSSLEAPEPSNSDDLTEELVQKFNDTEDPSNSENISPDMDWNTQTEPEASNVSDIDNITESENNKSEVSETENYSDEVFSESTEIENGSSDFYDEDMETPNQEETGETESLSSFLQDAKEENHNDDVVESENFPDLDESSEDQNEDVNLDDILGTETDFSVDDIESNDENAQTDEGQVSDFSFETQNESSEDVAEEKIKGDFETDFNEVNPESESDEALLSANEEQISEDFKNDELFNSDEGNEDNTLSSFENLGEGKPEITSDDFENDESVISDENNEDNILSSFENLGESEPEVTIGDFGNDESVISDEDNTFSSFDDVESFTDNEETENLSENGGLDEFSENSPVLPKEEASPFMVSEGTYEAYDDTISEDSVKVDLDNELWTITTLSELCDNPKVINDHSGSVTWGGDKYQSDLKVEINNVKELENWNVVILHSFSVPLDDTATELVIDKAPDVVRFASLMHRGEEKLKVFNQSSYKFISPQGEFFTVQGNVICGHIDKSFSLNIHDYVRFPVQGALNQYVSFKQPASGFLLGPKGVTVFFATAKGIAFVVKDKLPEAEVFEYEPSLKQFDSRKNFVYDEQSGTEEFMATGKQTCLIINTGASLFGWNIHFDNEMYLSLKDTLTYQAKQNKLPSPNGELSHEGKVFKFFGVEKIQARPKVLYYSYGKM